MFTYKRDEYTAKHSPGLAPGLAALLWVVASTLAAVVVRAVGLPTENANQWDGISSIVQMTVAGILTALIIGVAQTLVLMPYIGRIGSVKWMVATVIGRTISYVIASSASAALLAIGLGSARTRYSVLAGCLGFLFLMIVVGAITGAITGFAQSIVLRQYLQRSGHWILANMVASAASLFIGFLFLVDEDYYGSVITGITAGAITAVALVNLLRHGRSNEGRYSQQAPKWVDAPSAGDIQPSPEELLERARAEQARRT